MATFFCGTIGRQAARLCCRLSRTVLPGGLLCCVPFPLRFMALASRWPGGVFRRESSRIESSASPRFWLASWVWLGEWTCPNSRPPSFSLRVVLGVLSCSVIQEISSCLLLIGMGRLVDRVAARGKALRSRSSVRNRSRDAAWTPGLHPWASQSSAEMPSPPVPPHRA
jgi:hypothetical protein